MRTCLTLTVYVLKLDGYKTEGLSFLLEHSSDAIVFHFCAFALENSVFMSVALVPCHS